MGAEVNYTLVSGTGDTSNSSFTIGSNGQLQAAAGLAPGSYSVLVRSTSTVLLTDVLQLGSSAGSYIGPYTLQLTVDPSRMPAGFAQLAANAGLVSVLSVPTPGVSSPATTANKEAPGSLVQANYQGPYSNFWASVQAANPTAVLSNVVGSSGVDLPNHDAWSVIDETGNYAIGVQVYTEQVVTVTVT